MLALLIALLPGCSPKCGDSAAPEDSGQPAEEDAFRWDTSVPPYGDTGDGFHDPLSMPAEPTLDVDDFNSAESCATCHPTHYDQWRQSVHSYATVDPLFHALVGLRQDDYDGAQDPFCMQCHTAIGTRGGEVVPGFRFEDLSQVASEGVTCEACHKVSSVERPYNSGHVLDPTGPLRGPLEDPADNNYHASEHSTIFETSEFCAGCHDVVEISGVALERPYEEWLESPAGAAGRTCQSCHMDTWDGQAAVGGPERTGLSDHRFRGVEVPLAEGFIADPADVAALREKIAELLDQAGSIYLEAPYDAAAGEQLDLLVTLQNDIDGHNLPTGTTFIRQVWVELMATDATGRVLYQTGDLDENGDLRDFWSELDPYGDNDLLTLSSSLLDERGEPTVFTWRASELKSNALSPLYQRTYTLFIPIPEDAVGPITISSRLLFRSNPPWLLRLAGLGDLVDSLVIQEIGEDVLTIDLVDAG